MAELNKVKAAAIAREKHLHTGDKPAATSKRQKLDYELVNSIHELILLENASEDGGDGSSMKDYKQKTKVLLQKLLVKLEQSVSAQQLLEQQLRMKDEQLQAVQNELEMSRDLFAREQRNHRCAEEVYKRDLQRAENFLRKLGKQLDNLNSNFRILDEEDEEEAEDVAGEEGVAAKSEWEFGDCDIDSEADYSELLREDDFDNYETYEQTTLEKEVAEVKDARVLSPLTPMVGRRRSAMRRSSLFPHNRSHNTATATHATDMMMHDEPAAIVTEDTEEEEEEVEVFLLPGEEEADVSHIPTSVKKQHPNNNNIKQSSYVPHRRQSNINNSHNNQNKRRSSMMQGGRRHSQTARLSWVMPSLLQEENDENAEHKHNLPPTKQTTVVPKDGKLSRTVNTFLKEDERWLRGIKVKSNLNNTDPNNSNNNYNNSNNLSVMRGRDEDCSRRRSSLHMIPPTTTTTNNNNIVDNNQQKSYSSKIPVSTFSRPAWRQASPANGTRAKPQ